MTSLRSVDCNKVHSLIHSKGMDVDAGPQSYQNQPAPAGRVQDRIQASSTLNSIEVRFQPYQGGTRIEVDHGITVVGLILGLLLFFIFLLGAVVVLLWLLKYNEIKDDLKRTFPEYLPPSQQQYGEGTQRPPQQNFDSSSTPDETSDQITPER